ncbi:DNA ligase [Marinobacter halodurans]|uniref:DNA ligase n=1 Tax=Marinobacter halodurans TaxID=2528979 RepID=A0ABY1ZM29_9GAMM|nr:DNA polymerase ligase N-terminal domain-containing protein [Marinobacter halodurans]TBW53349.1 DNA ligase [Marinobacter halodurans]
MSDRQSEYSSKRNTRQSGEPDHRRHRPSRKENQFVIQMHDASQLHFDFRLAIDGSLKSWAVPKGPSLDPSDKRLAIEVEDHPLDYADFEGVIPEGHYGAGTVMVWDRGTYRNLREEGDKPTSMADAHRDGLIEVWLEGEKLSGGFALKRFREGKKPQWLLIKTNDDHADARRNPVSTENKSVKSGRTLHAIAKAEKPDD